MQDIVMQLQSPWHHSVAGNSKAVHFYIIYLIYFFIIYLIYIIIRTTVLIITTTTTTTHHFYIILYNVNFSVWNLIFFFQNHLSYNLISTPPFWKYNLFWAKPRILHNVSYIGSMAKSKQHHKSLQDCELRLFP